MHIAIEAGGQYTDEFLALNPKGVVPVVVHRGRVVTESSIISEYINDAFDGPSLMPKDSYWRARKRAWSMLFDTSIHLPHTNSVSFVIALRYIFMESLNTPEKLAEHLKNVKDPARREMRRQAFELGYKSPRFAEAIIAFDKMLANMDKQLEEVSWLAGDEISLADLDVAPYVHRLESLQLTNMWASYPHVGDWYERMTSRDSWEKAIRQQHIDKWVALMSSTGPDAWPEVETILQQVN